MNVRWCLVLLVVVGCRMPANDNAVTCYGPGGSVALSGHFYKVRPPNKTYTYWRLYTAYDRGPRRAWGERVDFFDGTCRTGMATNIRQPTAPEVESVYVPVARVDTVTVTQHSPWPPFALPLGVMFLVGLCAWVCALVVLNARGP